MIHQLKTHPRGRGSYEPLPSGEDGVSPAARGKAPFERYIDPQFLRKTQKKGKALFDSKDCDVDDFMCEG